MSLEPSETWKLIEGDSLEVLPSLEAVDHVITDPPYEEAAHTKQRRSIKGTRPNSAVGWEKAQATGSGSELVSAPLSFDPITETQRLEAAAHFARLARRWSIVFCQVEASVAWSSALEISGAKQKRIGVWVKPDGMPQLTGDRPAMGYESIVFAHAKGRSRWNGGGRSSVFVHNKGDTSEARLHETQKPLALMLELVSLFTDPGDLVLDPYAGSGTTGVACLRLGRRFIGIERDPRYAAIARERLEAESRGLRVSDARSGQRSIFDVLDGGDQR